MKLISNKVRVLAHRIDDDKFSAFLEHSQKKEMKLFGLTETNVNWRNEAIFKVILGTFRYSYPGGKFLIATSNIHKKGKYKPGGVLVGMEQSVIARMQEHGKDKMARWTYTKLEWTRGTSLLYVKLYVPHKKLSGLHSTATQKFHQLLRENPADLPQVLRSYEKDLHEFLASFEKTHILITGDLICPKTPGLCKHYDRLFT